MILSTSNVSVFVHRTISDFDVRRISCRANCMSSCSSYECLERFRLKSTHNRVWRSQSIVFNRRYIPMSTKASVEDVRFIPSVKAVLTFKNALWRFLRPHTVHGTVLGFTALVARALTENPHLITRSFLLKALVGLIALICGNGYIVGINQIYDIRIDKVNKPYLPVAAGDISVKFAWLLVLFFGVTGLLMVGMSYGSFVTSLYFIGLLLGTVYSVPPFRLKRFPVSAFLIIATVRGFLLNYGVYYATRDALSLKFKWSSAVAFITIFATLFALVIAITKDLPDVEGDRKFQISTLATKLGVRNIAFLGSGLLLLNYICAALAAVFMPLAFCSRLMIPTHTVMALSLIAQAWKLEQANYTKEAIAKFYHFIWKLFYAEYVLFPFI